MNKTREEAEAIIYTCIVGNLGLYEKAKKATQEILDALYGKPESERLLQMLRVKEALPNDFDGLTINYEALMSLIDAEIEKERAKP